MADFINDFEYACVSVRNSKHKRRILACTMKKNSIALLFTHGFLKTNPLDSNAFNKTLSSFYVCFYVPLLRNMNTLSALLTFFLYSVNKHEKIPNDWH